MKILITGIAGQDGSYLAELLTNQGHEVHGIIRRQNNWRLDECEFRKPPKLHLGEITDPQFINDLFSKHNFDQVYHLAAQTHVGQSFKLPVYTASVNLQGTQILLDAIHKTSEVLPQIYFASTSEVFGNRSELISTTPSGILPFRVQTLNTPMRPVSPYGLAKLAAQQLCGYYRAVYGFHIGIGILFNHESPRRGEEFVTRKITSTLAKIKYGLENTLELGPIDSSRDFGWAPDYVALMPHICAQGSTHILASGETHTIREFLRIALDYFKLSSSVVISDSPEFTRPCDVQYLCGQPTISFQNTPFVDIVHEMCSADDDRFRPEEEPYDFDDDRE